MDLPVVNHFDYTAKIGDDHKFPINKFEELSRGDGLQRLPARLAESE